MDEDFQTCPQGFCQHWACVGECDERCKCSHGCGSHAYHGAGNQAGKCEKCSCESYR